MSPPTHGPEPDRLNPRPRPKRLWRARIAAVSNGLARSTLTLALTLTLTLFLALVLTPSRVWAEAPPTPDQRAAATRPGGFTAQEARARMVLPPGFSAEVFASEPLVRQPVAATFDERGRMWVIEYLQYPNPAGLKPVTVDQYLRTEYDRFPEPPPRGPKGKDRIRILEDTDGDGTADQATTFVEGLNLASALAVGHGGVFVGQAPYLLFYPDKNHDDRPDGDPQVLLQGFGLQDAHATVNSMTWGPDGWLYGAQGSTVTAKIRGIEFQQGIWRYHSKSQRFELFAEGGGNTWGLDFDPLGHAFGSSNGGFVTFHMVQGGYYWKGFAKHGPLHNPNTFGYFNSVDYVGPKIGGHVTPGGIIYQGDAYPPEFRGTFIGGNLLANAVYWHLLTPKGSTFQARHGGTLIDSHDTWFRPIDLLTGPDGCVYVVDWYDQRASHLDPRDNWDRSNGRIYRIVHDRHKPIEAFNLAARRSEELLAYRTATNNWYAAEARKNLAERRDPSITAKILETLIPERNPVFALRDLWALAVSGGLDDARASELLGHPLADVRRWTIRLLGDDERCPPPIHARLIALAESDPDAALRSQLASSCQRWRAQDALPILEALVKRSEDVEDPQIPLLLWWALEKHAQTHRGQVVDLFLDAETLKRPVVARHLYERIARLLASNGTSEDLSLLARVLGAAPDSATRQAGFAGMDQGFQGRRFQEVPVELTKVLDQLAREQPDDRSILRVAYVLGSPQARSRVEQRATDPKLGHGERAGWVEVIGQALSPSGQSALLAVLADDQSSGLHPAALSALAGSRDAAVAEAIVKACPRWSISLRERAVNVLAAKPEWAARLLEALEKQVIAVKEIKTSQALQIAALGRAELTGRLEKVWGKVPTAGSPEKARRIAEIRGVLPEGDKGQAARGVLVFREACAGCHRLFNEGERIAPELTGAERGNLDFLLTSTIDPSAVIRKEYQAETLALSDGRVLTGLVIEETKNALTLFDAQKQKTVVPTAEIEARRAAATSIMPEGLLDTLKDEQIRDLFRYLQSAGPPSAAVSPPPRR